MAETALISISNIREYRSVSLQIETTRFNDFVMDVQRSDLRQLLGDSLYYDFMNDDRTSGKYKDLLDGKTYEYNGETIKFYGVKPFLCYLWLALFTREGDNFQSNSGNIQFVNNQVQNLQYLQAREKKEREQSYRESATIYENDIIKFLNTYSSTYTLWKGDTEKKLTSFNWPDPI